MSDIKPGVWFTAKEAKDSYDLPVLDMCSCSECGWKGKVTKCEVTYDGEGWEYPSYDTHWCPRCNTDCIDDFYPSETPRQIIIRIFKKLKP